ncbi:Protein-S-isoprenylcysteine O-methyltransferase Ste14 [Novosphingobium sp. CF614]|uniref:methyltransferase family protein n=1 Tax=Novosphingobium sp. CF614 TaxID=1884364 RepID=UPI0008E54B08|nr:isoprenylcysteine carboxylmethyltransferase family protein [Novosphingobium sp. CF614]SFG24813.1 Protein-S-isoprenylcysteine O-methyltransferase Ste14 [Novosphingobium sp. CF614]
MAQRLIHYTECTFLVVLAWLIVSRMVPVIPQHPQVIVFLTAELLGVVLIVLQRPGDVATELRPVLLGFAGTSSSLLVLPIGQQLAPDLVSTALITGGVALSILAKLSLRRSFGLVAANRGVKSSGLYRFVRHPMYSGYIVNHIGYLLLFCSPWNVAVIALCWILLWMRTDEEEKVLLKDPAYRRYADSVRSRLVPGLI